MSSRRPILLMAVLLLLLGWYVMQSGGLPFAPSPQSTAKPAEPLLPGENSISNVVVRQTDSGEWELSLDYYCTGISAWIKADLEHLPGQKVSAQSLAGAIYGLKRGTHHATIKLAHPGGAGITTRHILIEMRDFVTSRPAFASVRVDQVIEWSNWQEWFEAQEFAKQSPDENLDRAVELIDHGIPTTIADAKEILERLIQRDPSFERAYIELARVAMKTNWGPEGLHHAEGLLSSALQIKPDSANAKILLGYVYTHQRRYKLAEKLYVEAASTNPPNLWLWANWGEMLAMQGKFDQAAGKYKEAVQRPATLKTYERARADAYTKLLALLERKKDLDGMEALYKSGVEAFGQSSCHSLTYARFLLQQRGNADGAIELARKSLDVSCSEIDARETLGLAHYVAWSKRQGTARTEALNQARIYLPPGAKAMYLLAGSETTVKAAAQLVSSGESIDNKDNDGLNALAHAVQNNEVATARRLLRLGASPAAPVGYGSVPVALMPVMSGNLELIKLMRQFGADYGKISYEGATAFDFAKQSGDSELLEALEPAPRTL